MKTTFVVLAAVLTALFANNCTRDLSAQQVSKYAGEENREIKSLSADDIDQLKNGKGWGLAKAAELNGYPGPSHLMEMKSEIGLSDSQEKQIQDLFANMKSRAVPLGNQLIELERELDKSFSEKTVDEKKLRNLLEKIGKVRSDLRFVHLSVHLQTPKVLSSEQVAKYNTLRGYGAGDPCKNIPAGHDPAMWKQHNGCEQ